MNDDRVIGDKEVGRRFRALPEGARSRLADSVGRLVLRLQARVMRDKLSGQVLKVRTGTLRRSIDRQVITDGNVIAGVVSTNVGYGKAHEFGGLRTETVREHLRLVKQAFGKTLKSPVWATVGAHQRTVDLPERSFLRSALKDMQKETLAELREAAFGHLKP
ncbi:hypothetical protein [Ferribacterium limneticum]|uniref:hypothetical protein n=1 Tax=Ferribacterium limneticum TaxID=76259 RepID=UPI001CFA66E7|nr:hypothetical protein [Ferribacterium limneticum]UCV28113.1 HK97 gp10 family phage protein [Ferribacterium limneticum]UCV32030.1 HK97 gp10 family phage protein [Ferribacterium limneticum]